MATTIGLGVPFPKLLPITGTWAFPLAAYFTLLDLRVSGQRIKSNKMIGDKVDGSATSGSPGELEVAYRSAANFAEHVPLTLLLAAVAELNGANKKILNYTLASLFVLRIAHVEFGLRAKDNAGLGRPIGHFSTLGMIAGFSAYAAYLVKGYWGF